MALIWTDGRGARRMLVGLGLAGAAAGVLAPSLSALAPAAAPAALALALAVAGWLFRGARAPRPAALLLALGGGLLAGLLDGVAPAGLAHALLGLSVGLALTPKREGWGLDLLRALPAAAGAVTLGVVGGLCLGSASFAAWGVASQMACFGGLLGLGVGLGELSRAVLLARAEPPAWVAELLESCGAETRPVLSAAVDGHRRVVEGVVGSKALDVWDRKDALTRAERLLAAAAHAVEAADAAARASLGLGRDAGGLEHHPELLEARQSIRTSLTEQHRRARAEAGQRAADLTRMAAVLAERSLRGDLDPIDLLTLDADVAAPSVRLSA